MFSCKVVHMLHLKLCCMMLLAAIYGVFGSDYIPFFMDASKERQHVVACTSPKIYIHTQSLRSGECQTGLFVCLRSCNLIVSSSAPFLMHAEQGTRKLVDNWISGYGHIAPQKKHNKNQEFSACTAGRSS